MKSFSISTAIRLYFINNALFTHFIHKTNDIFTIHILLIFFRRNKVMKT